MFQGVCTDSPAAGQDSIFESVFCGVYCVGFMFVGSFVQQCVSTRPQTAAQPSLVNLPGLVNLHARCAAVMLMHAVLQRKCAVIPQSAAPKVDPKKTVLIGVATGSG